MAAQLSKMSYIFKRSCTLLSKVVTTYTTLVTLQLWKVAKVVESTIGRFPDAELPISSYLHPFLTSLPYFQPLRSIFEPCYTLSSPTTRY